VQPTLAGHGPTSFAGLSKRVDLRLVRRLEFGSGAVAMRYEPRRYRRAGLGDHERETREAPPFHAATMIV
jgi:hypothetical protein